MTETSRQPSTNLTIFAFLLAVGTLMHKTQLWEGLSDPLPILTTALCVLLLFLPWSPRLLGLFAVATLLEAAWYAPFYFLNHMVFVAFLCLGILGAFAYIYWRERRRPESMAELEPVLFPLFRAGVYVMFAFVLLHKTNSAFFDPTVGCGVLHYARLADKLPFLPSAQTLGLEDMLPYITYLMEGSIPLLLLFKRGRHAAMFIAFGFHYMMAINGYQGFSAFALAIYIPFLPVDLHRKVRAAYRLARRRWQGRLVFRWAIGLTALFAVSITLAHAADRTYQMERIGLAWFLVSSPVIFFIYAYLHHRRRRRASWPSGPPRFAWQYALLAILAFQSFMPYLGLKTQASFAMFSNVQTEEAWNHLFLPQWLKLAGFQDSLATITHVEGITLLRPWERDFLPGLVTDGEGQVRKVTQFELRRQISAHCRAGQAPIELSYEVEGHSYHYEDACQDPELSRGNGWLLEKLFWFRPVPRPLEWCIH